jgi:tetratricopeptide (TPR) repeat protein
MLNMALGAVLILVAAVGAGWAIERAADGSSIGIAILAAIGAAASATALGVWLVRTLRLRRAAVRANLSARQLLDDGSYRLAENELRQILATRKPADRQAMVARNNLAVAQWFLGRDAEAERTLRDGPETLRIQANLAALRRDAERLRAVLRRTERKHGGDARQTISVRGNLAVALHKSGDLQAAVREAEAAVAAALRSFGSRDPQTITLRANLAAVHRDLGEPATAEAILREDLYRLPQSDPQIITTQANLAAALQDQGRPDEATDLLDRVVNLRSSRLGGNHPATLQALTNRGFLHLSTGENQRAEADFAAVLTSAPDEDITARAREGLILARGAQG